MYHTIDDQEKYPGNYVLKEVEPSMTEDECFDFISKPRQTQKTVGLYLKKIKASIAFAHQQMKDGLMHKKTRNSEVAAPPNEMSDAKWPEKKFSLQPVNRALERNVRRNKGFWVGRPEVVAPLTYKLKEKYTVDIPRKTKRERGVFYRAKFLELDYLIERAKSGLLYSDEEMSDSEEEVLSDEGNCLELNKVKYRICDPCKEKKPEKEKIELKPPKDLIEDMRRKGIKPPFKKIPSGCQCDYFGEHNHPPTTWDNPFKDSVDMLRQHEMNKVLKPYRQELLSTNYEKHPPVKYLAHEPGMKRTFPVYQISNL